LTARLLAPSRGIDEASTPMESKGDTMSEQGPEQDAVRPSAEQTISESALPQAPPPPPAGYDAPAPPPGMFYDAESGLMLPNGTQLAPVGRRIGAWFLSIVLWIVTLVIGYVIWGIISWTKGTTPALQVLGMRCWRPEENRVPGFWWMALREIVGRIADGILSLISLLVSLILFLTGKEHKALHDYVAGTVVLYDPDKTLSS
jgi:uncharacterized RDD family membrane protein YckC